MDEYILLGVGVIFLFLGLILGYQARRSIAKKKIGSIEAELQKKISQTKSDIAELLSRAKAKAARIERQALEETEKSRREVSHTEHLLLKRENILEKKILLSEQKEKELQQKVVKLKEVKEALEGLKDEAIENLARISGLSKEQAKKELLKNLDDECQAEILERMRKLEKQGDERFEKRAKEILATTIQRFALSHAQEMTTTSVALPSDEIKGRIIGKDGRNIKVLEKLTGVEVIVDDTPEAVIISGFNPLRRHIAKIALEKLIKDGRIQPARIEEQVKKAEEEIVSQIREKGEAAVYEAGVLDLDPKLAQLLGRLHFRTSYGQNVLVHSIEVSQLASAIASEIGANVSVCKKAGLLHDIGKALDYQTEGSHVDIGIRILEKFNFE